MDRWKPDEWKPDIFFEHLHNIKNKQDAENCLRKFTWYIYLILRYSPHVDEKIGEKYVHSLDGFNRILDLANLMRAKWVPKTLRKFYQRKFGYKEELGDLKSKFKRGEINVKKLVDEIKSIFIYYKTMEKDKDVEKQLKEAGLEKEEIER